jgi:hypothetical protein
VLPNDSLTLVDRGFIDYGVFHGIVSGGDNRHFMTRAKSNLKWRVIRNLGPDDDLVELRISKNVRRKDPTLRAMFASLPFAAKHSIYLSSPDANDELVLCLQDLADAIMGTANPSVLRGGEFFYLVRAELRFPIYGAIHGAVFTDLGNHWADPTLIVFNADFVRPTLGFGGRVVTPVGPLAIDLGFNPMVREALNEPIVAVHFSLGVF